MMIYKKKMIWEMVGDISDASIIMISISISTFVPAITIFFSGVYINFITCNSFRHDQLGNRLDKQHDDYNHMFISDELI